MNCLLVASRTRPDIDLPKSIGMYEFTVVPTSLFCPDGSFYKEQKKSVIAEALRELQNEQEEPHIGAVNSMEYHSDCKKVMIIDGMAFVKKVAIKTSQVRTAECFISIISSEIKEYDEVRIIFDRYDPESLKSNTRASCTLGLSAVRYKITDNTKIGHLETNKRIYLIYQNKKRLNRIP